VLDSSRERIESMLAEDAVVLDVGGWASPLARADWVIDVMPYETRGLYGESDPAAERFSGERWIERDVCDRDPWPFADGQFDFAVCSHTLEDVRDPVWVCSELARVARAGYVEVPSRLEEQAFGVHGPWVGWSHHHWLVDITDGRLEFVFKTAVLQGREDCRLTAEQRAALTEDERVQTLFWERRLEARERIFLTGEELDRYLAEGVAGWPERLDARLDQGSRGGMLRRTRRGRG
jgi:hypothetical protein